MILDMHFLNMQIKFSFVAVLHFTVNVGHYYSNMGYFRDINLAQKD